MSFQVRTEERPGAAGPLTVCVLEDGRGAVAKVCPALGFNCYRWHVPGAGELLYCDPNFFTDGKPTRSGIPVLFPFPNRIRDGRYSWDGKEYQLPLNDPSGRNAIHGFACRHSWQVVDHGADERSAWVVGEFRGGVDAPQEWRLWPADYRLWLTCRLRADRLQLEAVVEHIDQEIPFVEHTDQELLLPFGLGYHPYFLLPDTATGEPPDGRLEAPARSYWELKDSLPTGAIHPVEGRRDLNGPRSVRDLTLDDVLTGVPTESPPGAEGLCPRGRINRLFLYASSAFRELVVFTPPHRKAVCLEPYTCTTDAINLQQRGVDAGLLVLPPGETWTGTVEMVVVPG